MKVFDLNAKKYDEWFERNKETFYRELRCLAEFTKGFGLEVGVGTGRFAEKLGINVGVDTSGEVLRIAKGRVENVLVGDAHELPFKDETFDAVYFITTICFLKRPEDALAEAWRVLKFGGTLVIAFVPLDSPLGKEYDRLGRKGHVFYSVARFYETGELLEMIERVGFEVRNVRSTFVKYSDSDFVCVEATKQRERIALERTLL